MRRKLAVVGGLLLIALAFIAATNVADTREGLIAEIVTLLSVLAGVALLLYGLIPKRARTLAVAPQPVAPAAKRPRSANDLVLGGAGLLLALILLTGLVLSAGWLWALVGTLLLLPMMIGCAYLLAAFIRAPDREWRIDIRRLTSSR